MWRKAICDAPYFQDVSTYEPTGEQKTELTAKDGMTQHLSPYLTLAEAKLRHSLQADAETFGKMVDFGREKGEKYYRKDS